MGDRSRRLRARQARKAWASAINPTIQPIAHHPALRESDRISSASGSRMTIGLIAIDRAIRAAGPTLRPWRDHMKPAVASPSATMLNCFHHSVDAIGAKTSAASTVDHHKGGARWARSRHQVRPIPASTIARLTIVSRRVAVVTLKTLDTRAIAIPRNGVLIHVDTRSGWPDAQASCPPV